MALMLLFTAGAADTAHGATHQAAAITAAAPSPTAHRAHARATRSVQRKPLPKKKAAPRRLVKTMTEIRQSVYMPVVQCWNGVNVVDHPNQQDCPPRPKVVHRVVPSVSHQSVTQFVASLPSPWPAIVRCESLRDDSWHTYSHSMARGLFQFLRSSWARMGGSGDPAAASWDEQYAMARKLARLEGLRSWDCARMLGYA